jgi:hypothetical protein
MTKAIIYYYAIGKDRKIFLILGCSMLMRLCFGKEELGLMDSNYTKQ